MKKLTTSQRIKQDKPIEIWENAARTWKWKVWRKYQKAANEDKNQYARWFCTVTSPMTYGSGDMGDVYVADIKKYATQTYAES
jgi:hypothetical protein